MKHNQQKIKHRIDQLKHLRIISSSKFQFYQAFSFAGAFMVIAAILYFLNEQNKTMLFFCYAVLLVALISFCVSAIKAHIHDKKINLKIEKNYDLLLNSNDD